MTASGKRFMVLVALAILAFAAIRTDKRGMRLYEIVTAPQYTPPPLKYATGTKFTASTPDLTVIYSDKPVPVTFEFTNKLLAMDSNWFSTECWIECSFATSRVLTGTAAYTAQTWGQSVKNTETVTSPSFIVNVPLSTALIGSETPLTAKMRVTYPKRQTETTFKNTTEVLTMDCRMTVVRAEDVEPPRWFDRFDDPVYARRTGSLALLAVGCLLIAVLSRTEEE